MKSTTLLLFPLAMATVASVAGENDWKLQPLKYNHPGLVVGLGVGLWAWPMPMDYDGDGDMDLLVACPDRISTLPRFRLMPPRCLIRRS